MARKKYKYTGQIVGERGSWAFFAKGIGGGFLVEKKTRAKARKARNWFERMFRTGKLE